MRQVPECGIAFAPRLPDTIIERRHLIQRLQDASTPLLIVRGPGGSGKSALVADWLRRYPSNGVWVTLDASAAHRLSFWQRVVDAALESGSVPSDSALRGIVTSSESAAGLRAALLRGFARGPSDVTLILDDFHEVTDARVQEDLHWLLQSGAPLRIVIVTRTATPLELPDHIARVDTTVILPPELAFSPEEVRETAITVGAEPSAATNIHAAFSGLALPTRAALLDLASGRAASVDEAIANLAGDGRFPLNLDPASEQALFLLRSSIAARLSPKLAAQFDASRAVPWLAQLEHEGFGSWTSRAGHAEFVIHGHLRQQLEAEAISRLAAEISGLRTAYAHDRIDHDDPMEAARQFALIDDLDGVVRVIRRFYGDLVRLYPDEIAALLRTIEPVKLRRHPELIAMLLVDAARTPGAPKVGILHLATLGIAGAQARFGHADPVDRISLLMTLLTGQRLSGNYDAARGTADRIVEAVGTLDVQGREALRGLLPQALIHAGTTYFYADDPAAAGATYREALSLAQSVERPWAVVHADSMLALTDAVRGDLDAARSRVEAARPRTRPQGWQGTYTASGHHLAAAQLALEDFDAAGARAQLDQLSEHEATIEHWPVIAHLRAMAALVDGKAYLGLDRLDRDLAAHADRPPTSRAMVSLLTTTRSELLLADRQAVRAAETLRSRRDPRIDLARSRVDLAIGDYSGALEHAAGQAWSNASTPRAKATAMLTVAIAARHLRQESAANDAAVRAVDVLAASGLRLPLMRFPSAELRALFEQAGLDAAALMDRVPDVFPPLQGGWRLTPAEQRVLAALRSTTSIDGLAAELHLSSNTVKTHLRQLYRKLGATSREEALGIAALHGLVENSSGGA